MGTFRGQDFPHLYRELLIADIEWHTNIKRVIIRCPRVLMKLSEKIAFIIKLDRKAHNLV